MITRFMLVTALLGLHAATSRAITLDECIRNAIDSNPDLEASLARVDAATHAVGEARSAWYPTVNASGSYTRTDNPPQAFFMSLNQRQADLTHDFNHPDDTDNIRGSLGFKMLLADAGQRSLGIRMSQLSAGAARSMSDAARSELIHQVTRAYFTVEQARSMIEVQEATLNSIRENLRVARERFAVGSALKTDVLNLEVQEADASEGLIRARNQLKLAIAALNTAIGIDLVSDSNLPEHPADDLKAPPADVQLDEIDNRPERDGAAQQAEAAALDYKRANRNDMPRLVAFGSVDWDSDSFSAFEDSYIVGAAAEWDLFTGFRQRHAAAAAKSRASEARARESSLRNQLRLELQQALLNTQEAWERIVVAASGVAGAEEALRITHERYEQGAADITELLTAQVMATAAHTREVMSRYDYLIAESNLKRARGLIQYEPMITNDGASL